MKGLLKILVVGFLVFVALALVQERQVFLSSWFGDQASAAPGVAAEDRRAAEEAVSQMLTMMRHLYSSDGDPRFAERMPAGQVVVDELMEDIEYLRRNRRRQEPQLMRLVVDSVRQAGSDRVLVRSTEHWVIHILWSDGSAEAEPPHAVVVSGLYTVARERGGWRVMWWESDFSDAGDLNVPAAPPVESGDDG